MRADGRTGYSRLKGREYTTGIGIAKFGEAIWYKLPKTADLTKLDDRWRTAIWLGKSDRRDEHIIGLENGAVLARSVQRKWILIFSPHSRRRKKINNIHNLHGVSHSTNC